eukprot:CAMPEP_0171082766 /NCGR_PEP_ID=MMETSP0766_2-20121228/17315_1 /TAXON_ID=439317 /ORGANISM="Gambierdiscus australes, Strain CAWD 149" /LENGTH=101 /DNA_ID=CAMNT_0011540157 /DNA_START=49 /DNA_END=351 /DNA_ORIENTATION=-
MYTFSKSLESAAVSLATAVSLAALLAVRPWSAHARPACAPMARPAAANPQAPLRSTPLLPSARGANRPDVAGAPTSGAGAARGAKAVKRRRPSMHGAAAAA